MRVSAAVIAASLAAIVNAQSAYFPFAPEGACVAGCTNSVGKTFFENYTDLDEYSPYFIESLSYTFERGSPKTTSFMTKAGMCMGMCPQEELDLYTANYPTKLEWYNLNKNSPSPPRPTTQVPTTTTDATTTTVTSTTPTPTLISGDFPFFPDGPCVSNCAVTAGKSFFPNYTEDPTSPYFLESLSYTFERGSEKTQAFMSAAGRCMGSCPSPELDIYQGQYNAKLAWYRARVSATTATTATTTTTTEATSTTATTTATPVPSSYFPFAPEGACVVGCTTSAGLSMFPNYSEDPASPYFIESLSYSYESGSANTGAFMTKAGMCMGRCPQDELDLYNAQYPGKKAWYLEHKGTTTTAPATTAPTTARTTTTTSASTVPTSVPDNDFPFEPEGACVSSCTNSAGKAMFPNYSEDPKSPYFIESLSYSYESGSLKTQEFMTKAGMCMGKCPQSELDLYNSQYQAKKTWYFQHKNTAPTTTTSGSPVTTTKTTTTTSVPTSVPGGDFPFKPEGACVSKCTNSVGKAMFPNYSEDPKSPYFIESLSYSYESGSTKTQDFMTKAGMCMGTCPQSELDLYTAQYPGKKAWYLANKGKPTGPVNPTPTSTKTTVPTSTPGSGSGSGTYPFKPNGACVSKCTNQVGKAMFPNYSEDPKSPYFIESLSYTFERGSAKTTEFMTKTGMCMGTCPQAELDLYTAQYPAQLEWYNANKNGGSNPTNPTDPTDPTNPTNPGTNGPFDYPFEPNGACVAGCTNEVGKAMFPNYSEDPSSPYFIESLSYTFERGSAKTTEFMTKTGMCMGKCPQTELDLYTAQYPAQLEWYNANKNGSGGGNGTEGGGDGSGGNGTGGSEGGSGGNSTITPSTNGTATISPTSGTVTLASPSPTSSNLGSGAVQMAVSGFMTVAALLCSAVLVV
ncbi:hypothetical protein BGZ80_001177 [Entomortierella chlamydospora]|uniref:Uncharacterized protein n=1 Tax=Entomortierella chlamydospora TaxID=101097 RepID=A0A9P6SY53_9FUNG|nr:hypothetical protein BGZ80_001177 [Entomortierella chlamydospora]